MRALGRAAPVPPLQPRSSHRCETVQQAPAPARPPKTRAACRGPRLARCLLAWSCQPHPTCVVGLGNVLAGGVEARVDEACPKQRAPARSRRLFAGGHLHHGLCAAVCRQASRQRAQCAQRAGIAARPPSQRAPPQQPGTMADEMRRMLDELMGAVSRRGWEGRRGRRPARRRRSPPALGCPRTGPRRAAGAAQGAAQAPLCRPRGLQVRAVRVLPLRAVHQHKVGAGALRVRHARRPPALERGAGAVGRAGAARAPALRL